MNKAIGLLVMLGLAATPVLADSVGPGGTLDPGTNSFGVLTTPPLQNSDLFTVPVSYHSTFAYSNWAGAVFAVVYDPTEVTFNGLATAVGFQAVVRGTGTLSGGSAFASFSFWAPNAFNSGTFNGPESQPFPLGGLIFHVTNTTPANNGDVDIVFPGTFGWNIFHSTGYDAPVTTPRTSGIYYVGLTPSGQPDPLNRPVPPMQGTWIHAAAGQSIRLTDSGFFGTTAYFLPTGGVAVEHLPEPAAAALLVGGAGMLVLARRRAKA